MSNTHSQAHTRVSVLCIPSKEGDSLPAAGENNDRLEAGECNLDHGVADGESGLVALDEELLAGLWV